MRAGILRDHVTIERQVEQRQTGGEIAVGYEPYLTDIAAAIEYTGRWRESLASAQIGAEIDCRIRIRYRDGLTEKMRVRHYPIAGSPTVAQYFDIQAIMPADGRRVELHLFCIKRQAEGFRTGPPT